MNASAPLPDSAGLPGPQPHPVPSSTGELLVDRLGRVHTSLRVSVTDRCNIRCFYCMPDGPLEFLPRASLLSFEELVRFVRIGISMGIRQVRLTGGEPLVRHELWRLVEMLRALPGLTDLALTTNGILLPAQAAALRAAGLDRLNISLDSLRPEIFQQITRRDRLPEVLAGIDAAREAGFSSIRINAVSIAGLTEPDILPLVDFCRRAGMHLRFIEFMPLDADGLWSDGKVLGGDIVRRTIEEAFGPLRIADETDPHQPATDWVFADGKGKVGFINPVTEPFCGSCNRLRITAEGQLRNCLFSQVETDIRALLRGGAGDDEIRTAIRDSVAAKKAGHGIDGPDFRPPARAMYQIGG